MYVQKSFEPAGTGTLYLVATPIGNLEDMTYRAVRILQEVDEIAAEDTRRTKTLLTHFNISTPLSSYHEHNKRDAGAKLLDRLFTGRSVALVSDAGTPAVSDPGFELVEEAIRARIPVVTVPGANAALSALVASGLAVVPFHFYGFLPRTPKKLKEKLELLRPREGTFIFYEAPHRVTKTVAALQEVWGDRQAVLARELTKKHELYARGRLGQLLDWLADEPVRGECCLIVEGEDPAATLPATVDSWWHDLTVVEHVARYVEAGHDRKSAMKKTAADRGTTRRDIYRILHQERPEQ